MLCIGHIASIPLAHTLFTLSLPIDLCPSTLTHFYLHTMNVFVCKHTHTAQFCIHAQSLKTTNYRKYSFVFLRLPYFL